MNTANQFADIFGLGTPELIIIGIILLLLFGAKKLPELARSLGTSANELKKGLNGTTDEKTSRSDDGGKAKEK